MSIAIKSLQLGSNTCVFDTVSRTSLFRADVLDPIWLDSIQHHDMLDIHSTCDIKLRLSGAIALHLRTCEARTCVKFGVVNKLVMTSVIRMTFIDGSIKSIHPAERGLVLRHSPTVPTLTVHEAERKTKKNNTETRQENEEALALLVTTIRCESKSMTFVRHVVLKATCDTPLLGFPQAASLIQILPHGNVAKTHACMTAKCIMEVNPGRPFHITTANFGMAGFYLLRHRKVGEVLIATKR